jgi:hypothetical protein
MQFKTTRTHTHTDTEFDLDCILMARGRFAQLIDREHGLDRDILNRIFTDFTEQFGEATRMTFPGKQIFRIARTIAIAQLACQYFAEVVEMLDNDSVPLEPKLHAIVHAIDFDRRALDRKSSRYTDSTQRLMSEWRLDALDLVGEAVERAWF